MRNLPRIGLVVFAIASPLAGVGVPCLVKAIEPSNVVLESALSTFRDDTKRDRIRSSTASELARESTAWAWFKGFRGTVAETNANLELIVDHLPVKANPFFAVDSQVEPGDVLRVRWGEEGESKEAMLVYIGEEKFPDQDQTRSFFIWPYRTRLEYNTLPARKHYQFLQERYVYTELKLDVLYKFTDADSQRAGTEWMRPGIFGRNCYLKTSMLNGTAEYAVYRAKKGLTADGLPDEGSFGGTTYTVTHDVSGDRIHISFDPTNPSAAVGSAERIGHVQVIQVLANGKVIPFWEVLKKSESSIERKAATYYEQITTPDGHFVDKGFEFSNNWEITSKPLENDDIDSQTKASVLAGLSELRPPSAQTSSNPPTSYGKRTKSERWNAVFVDEPNYTLDVNAGEKNVTFQFETWSWCEKGLDLDGPRWYDGVIWEFRVTQTSTGSQESRIVVTDTETNSPSASFLAAFERYNQRFQYRLSNDLTYSEAVQLFKFLSKAPVSISINGNEAKNYRINYENILLGESIEFTSLAGGCQYRAHAMCEAIRRRHPRIKCRKVFSIASGFPEATITPLKNGQPVQEPHDSVLETVNWAFHVAPVIAVEGQDFVFDPSLFENPVSIDRWLESQSDSAKRHLIPPPTPDLADYPYMPNDQSTPDHVSWVKFYDLHDPPQPTIDSAKLAMLLQPDGSEQKHEPEGYDFGKGWGRILYWRKSVQNAGGTATVLFAEKNFMMDAEVVCRVHPDASSASVYEAISVEVNGKATLPMKVNEARRTLPQGEQGIKVPVAIIVHHGNLPGIEILAGLGSSENHHGEEARYHLPLEATQLNPCVCAQAHNSSPKHYGHNRFALDFVRAVAHQDSNGVIKDNHWPVYAMRAGRIVLVKQDEPEGSSEDNEVWIRHEDGSVGSYNHLESGSVQVQLGADVQAGSLIAKTGLVGGHEHEHLHVQVDVYSGVKNRNWEAEKQDFMVPVPIDTKFVHRNQSGAYVPIPKIVKVKQGSQPGSFLQGAYIND